MFTILYFPIVNQKLGVSLKVVMGIRSSLCCHVKLESCFLSTTCCKEYPRLKKQN